MAEATSICLTSTLLSTISSPPCLKAFSHRGARAELMLTRRTIETIQALLIDAEKHSQQSPAVRNWIRMLCDLLLTADDLLDEAFTRHQQMNEGPIGRKVLNFMYESNAFTSFTLTHRLKSVRKNLDKVCKDAQVFNFSPSSYEEPKTVIRNRVGTGAFIDQDSVVGRADDSEKFLLVIDDLNHEASSISIRQELRSLLTRNGTRGSKIIVTTRSLLVARAMEADIIHYLQGLTLDASWALFKRLAFTREQENDPSWNSLGRKILSKFANVPLAISTIASLLYTKSSKEEWRSILDFPIVNDDFRLIQTLNLSYDHLPTNLKLCFSYCSLFPKDYEFPKDDLICLWTAQGYIIPYRDGTYEEADSLHACVLLRSLLFTCGGLLRPLVLEQLLTRFKLLRALNLQHQNIEEVPSSIGGLLHLRYLNLSGNKFRKLPHSITKLLNLLTLDISWCVQLEVLPVSFRKLINLRHLYNRNCDALKHMPPKFMNLAFLQHLSYFKVGKVTSDVKSSGLDSLHGLKLKGQLQIRFDNDVDNWDEDERWQLPTTVQVLQICSYPGMRIPHWDQKRVDLPSLLPKLVKVHISESSTIKHLPPFRHLPYLKALYLSSLNNLAYIEEAQDETEQCDQSAAGYSMLSFPCLEELELIELPRLMAWSRGVGVTTSKFVAAEEHSSCRDHSDQMSSFPILSRLKIGNCPILMSVPPCPYLQKLELQMIKEELMQHVLSTCSHSLETVAIRHCNLLNSEKLTSLRYLELSFCNEVKNLYFPIYNVLKELVIEQCPRLKLWESKEGGVDWDSLINLRVLSLDKIPDGERLPVSLSLLTALGKLQINATMSEGEDFPKCQVQFEVDHHDPKKLVWCILGNLLRRDSFMVYSTGRSPIMYQQLRKEKHIWTIMSVRTDILHGKNVVDIRVLQGQDMEVIKVLAGRLKKCGQFGCNRINKLGCGVHVTGNLHHFANLKLSLSWLLPTCSGDRVSSLSIVRLIMFKNFEIPTSLHLVLSKLFMSALNAARKLRKQRKVEKTRRSIVQFALCVASSQQRAFIQGRVGEVHWMSRRTIILEKAGEDYGYGILTLEI
ncbi:LOW QUALITY PROTEIN: hypothetical protein V2J09_010127 [Rumex salicifolius]